MPCESASSPRNAFKQALASCKCQIGLWCSMASPIGAEILAGAGFDWIVIDGEHAPNDIPLAGLAASGHARWHSRAGFSRTLERSCHHKARA